MVSRINVQDELSRSPDEDVANRALTALRRCLSEMLECSKVPAQDGLAGVIQDAPGVIETLIDEIGSAVSVDNEDRVERNRREWEMSYHRRGLAVPRIPAIMA